MAVRCVLGDVRGAGGRHRPWSVVVARVNEVHDVDRSPVVAYNDTAEGPVIGVTHGGEDAEGHEFILPSRDSRRGR